MTDSPDTDQKAVRIPVVASYAYELVHQIFPLRGLPLRVHTKALGGSGDVVDSARYQVNAAYLTFHDTKVVAEVRSWEPKEPGSVRKTLQRLTIEHEGEREITTQLINELTERLLEPHCIAQKGAFLLKFEQRALIAHGPEIIIKR